MTTVRIDAITSPGGGTFDARIVLPAAGHGPGILLLQEIFGVNAYIRDVADRLAGLGYVVCAPDVFWRVRPNLDIDSSRPEAIPEAIEIAGQWDAVAGLADLGACLDHLRGMPEVQGEVGVIGFCFGGTQTYRVASTFDVACAVSYYGSGIASMLDGVATLHCPIIFHFGDADPYIPNDEVDAIRAATAARHDVVVYQHAGGKHAFDNHHAPHFSQPEIAAEAWQTTAAFLFAHLGGPGAGA